MKDATYVEAAGWGKYRWWRYVLGLVVILVSWLVIGSVGSAIVSFALFVPIALVLTAIQTTTEELFFRGYVVQGASLIWSNRFFLAIVSAVVFTLPHLGNPEAQAGDWLTVFCVYFVGTGLVWGVVSLVDGTTELAIGAHFANNIGGLLVVNIAGSVMTTPALFTISEYHTTYGALSILVAIPVFLAIAYGVFERKAPIRFLEPSEGHRRSRKTISKCTKGGDRHV